MSSQISSDVINGTSNPNPNWEQDLLDMLSEYQNNQYQVIVNEESSNQVSENVNLQTSSQYQNIPAPMEYTENQTRNYITASENTTLLSPPWEEQPVSKQNTLNMSTYFSTFNPTQSQTEIQQHPTVHQIQTQRRYFEFMEKSHRAKINASASTSKLKTITKRKRKRTVFTTEQVEMLELVFAKKPYITREDRQILVQQLQLSDKSVKIWFQNRRLKGKREDNEASSEDVCDTEFNRLDYFESKINERTNEFGYVTLDDKIMSDLVSIIDDCLYKAPNVDSYVRKEKVSPIYEPISPASIIEGYSNEDHSLLTGHESLQRLVDIESIIS